MLKVYKTKKMIEEIGSAKLIQKGFKVSLHNGNAQYLLLESGHITGSFRLTSDDLAIFLGRTEEVSVCQYKFIAFNINTEGEAAFLHLDKNYYLLSELENQGGMSA